MKNLNKTLNQIQKSTKHFRKTEAKKGKVWVDEMEEDGQLEKRC